MFQLFGNACIAGVFQIRENEPQGLGVTATQAGSLRVGGEAMGFDHRTHTLHRAAADALLFGLAVDDIAGSRYGHTGQSGDIAEFHRKFLVIPGLLAQPDRELSPILCSGRRRPLSQLSDKMGLH
ncbi:hypothetical protein D3C79_660950 [compost metagenome]